MTERVVLITGASSGIGRATARAAAGAGCRLVLAARGEERLRALAAELGDSERVLTLCADVTSFDDQTRLVNAALARFGRIDVVFANAGIPGVPGGFTGADPEPWRALVLTNVLGVAYTVRASLAALQASRGHLVITGSVAGRRTITGSMYSATKWAVSAIGYGVREELRASGVRVTLIEPGMVETAFFAEPKPDALKPEDVARAVMYAISQPAHVDVHEIMVLPTPPAGA